MELKPFQKSALTALRTYLERARITESPESAFIEALQAQYPEKTPPPYRTIPGLPGVPNVCLRLPTGGGKTLLAAHTIAVAGEAYLEKEFPVVLWLVPTNTIRKQTAEALKNTSHPYRKAIDANFGGKVSVFDISDIEQIRPQDLTDRVAVIVGTIQTLRITNTDGRRVYSHAEQFEPHFSKVPKNLEGLQREDSGDIKYSFVNLMAVHRPLVIVDEAHKAGTNLSFEMLAALRPSCIIEFTATPNTDPKNGSNVLFRASASEVKNAEMIKLPIILTEHQDWKASVHDAIETRNRLAETAKKDAQYIRPLTLFQAQDRGQEVTVDVLKQYLIDNERIAPERIAVATGEQRELDTINLFDPECQVDFIITVEALKEGWDCSFAYVLCSVANVGAATDIEQLLGRVLRMPYAKSRAEEALNRAYAHVSSPRFGEGAKALTDTLIDKMGFEEQEAAEQVQVRQPGIPGIDEQLDLWNQPPVMVETVDVAPDLSGLSPEVASQVRVEPQADGTIKLTVQGDVPQELEDRLLATMINSAKRNSLKTAVARHRLAHRKSQSPAQRGEKFAVPRLFLNVQGQLELAEEELLLDLGGWSLASCPATLSESDFSIKETAERWEVDLKGEKVVYKHLDQSVQLEIGLLKLDWTELVLSRWLDKECRQADITQPVLLEFCRKVIAHLTEKRGIALRDLLRFKYQLARVVTQTITKCRRAAYADAYQTFLFSPSATVETSNVNGFSFHNQRYPAGWLYQGAYQFKKHFFSQVGELEGKGEEFECAQTIDTISEVKHWVRNLSGRHQTSFWLPTSTDRFYPDFVVALNDDRVLVVEYKGEHIATTDDTKEKRNVGELWAEKSGGKGLFLMAEKRDADGRDVRAQITKLIK
ncbi:putative type III restriction enzyme, res subunit [Thiocapsa sp. KS1]|nr:DEAD/DEAH box helicase family protein [Thiocapsa sp. KS1]CRI66955.1 putative type III restriction enzyme, res subunit [Thiocapsa sp. KS1]